MYRSGRKTHAPVPDRCDRRRRELGHLAPPLQRDQRLDPRAATVAVADRVPVRLRGLEQLLLAEPGDDPLLGLLLLEPGELAGGVVHEPVEPDDGELRKPVRAADLEVHRVVAGRDLHRAGAELRIDAVVRDDRDPPLRDGQNRLLPDELAVALVLGVNGDGDIREHRRRAHGRDRDVARAVGERVADRVERVVLVRVVDLEVGDRARAARAPVDDAVVAIEEPSVVEVDEVLEDGAHVALVQREALAPVVERGPEAPELAVDHLPVVLEPLPGPLDERLAAEVVPAEPFLRELALDDVLGRDSRVVVARLPERVEAAHAVIADEEVLDRRVHPVPHVQVAGDVRRRDRDHERRALGVRLGLVEALGLPRLLPARFDAFRLVQRIHGAGV